MSVDPKILENYNLYIKNLIPESIETAKLHDIDLVEYKNFIRNMLITRAGMSEFNADRYVSLKSLETFVTAVTHFSVDPFNNYEYLETVGDSTLNNIFVWIFYEYMQKYDKEFTITRKVYTMSKLKSMGVSKESYAELCELIGLSKFIRYKELQYKEKDQIKSIIRDDSMKEDVFEAFFGAMCYLFDSTEEVNCGYNIVSFIIKNLVIEHKILDRISVDPKDLEDPGTMLKEIYDTLRNVNKENTYEFKKDTEVDPLTSKFRVTLVLTYVQDGVKKTHNFSDFGFNMKELRKKLSRTALLFLENEYKIKWDYKTKK